MRSYHCHSSLDDCQQWDTNGVGAHSHRDFIRYLLCVLVVEGEQVVNIRFHFLTSQQHEVQDEYHDKQIDGKATDATHD